MSLEKIDDTTFSLLSPKTLNTDWYPTSALAADFNNDGKKDLCIISTGYGGGNRYGSFSLFLGNGIGVFSTKISYNVGFLTSPNSAVTGDINFDGLIDIIIRTPGTTSIAVITSKSISAKGVPIFNKPIFYATSGTPTYGNLSLSNIKIADLDKDGHIDIVTGGDWQTQKFHIFYGAENSLFESALSFDIYKQPKAHQWEPNVFLEDFNSDGFVDIASGDKLFLSDHGKFEIPNEIDSTPAEVRNILASNDLNNDSVPDLVVYEYVNLSIYLSIYINDGKGNFTANRLMQPVIKYAVSIEDLNNDGWNDLVISVQDIPRRIEVYINNKGNFDLPLTFLTPSITISPLVTDLNSDGMADIVSTNFESNSASVFFQKSKFGTNSNDELAAIQDGSLFGFDGSDMGYGSYGNEYLDGGVGQDVLLGYIGDDIFVGGLDEDTIEGGEGDDIILDEGSTESDLYDGGSGVDTISYETTASAVIVDLSSGTAEKSTSTNNLQLSKLRLDSSYTINTFSVQPDTNISLASSSTEKDRLISIEAIIATNYSDILIGNSDRNEITPGDGNDTVDGGSNLDTIVLKKMLSSYDIQFFETGKTLVTDTSTGEADEISNIELMKFSDTLMFLDHMLFKTALVGKNEADSLFATSQNFNVYGLSGNDKLTGNDQDNIIVGGIGDDLINGGNGVDTAAYFGNFNNYNISVSGKYLTVSQKSGIDEGTDKLQYVENLVFSDISFVAALGDGLNNILGGNNDSSFLFGGKGDDTLIGSEHYDVLDGGLGKDILIGGEGSDRFRLTTKLNSRNNIDTIQDFSSGTDKIELGLKIFTRLSNGIQSENFVINELGIASDNDDYLIFNSINNTLYYDADGSGSKSGIAVVILSGIASLSVQDFIFIN